MMSDGTTESDDLEDRWPKEGDRLFVESGWSYDACVATVRKPAERFYRMPMGYKRAGDILIDRAAVDVVDRPNVIYAAIFCYRQSIELFLKGLVEEFGAHSPQYNHDLASLWKRFMSIVDERGARASDGLSAMERLVMEMDEADRRSTGFRYPEGSVGPPFLTRERGIDLANIREVMQGMQNFFECCHLHFAHQDDPGPIGNRWR